MKKMLSVDCSPWNDAAVEEVSRELPTPPTDAWVIPAYDFEEIELALRQQARNIIDFARRANSAQKE